MKKGEIMILVTECKNEGEAKFMGKNFIFPYITEHICKITQNGLTTLS